jgi:hypothetical protein
MKYIIVEKEPIARNGNRVFSVRRDTSPEWKTTEVWWDGDQAWCNRCSGPLVAMSRSCKHSTAVKRYVKKTTVFSAHAGCNNNFGGVGIISDREDEHNFGPSFSLNEDEE